MNDTKKFNLPPLPYGENDLSPIISSDTIQLHYGKHHQAYFNMLNTLAEGTKYSEMSLENVVVESFKDKEQKIFNNAGQAWNHILYWNQMKPGGESSPSGRLHTMIEDSFGDFDSFKEQFVQQSVGVFGSGCGGVSISTPFMCPSCVRMHGVNGRMEEWVLAWHCCGMS